MYRLSRKTDFLRKYIYINEPRARDIVVFYENSCPNKARGVLYGGPLSSNVDSRETIRSNVAYTIDRGRRTFLFSTHP